MTVSVAELAERVFAVVNAARAAKTDENVVSELETVLKELRDSESRLEALVDVSPEIPHAQGTNPDLEQCRGLLTTLAETATTDAVGAARSDEGRTMVRDLRNGVAELNEATTEAWNDLRLSLRADVHTDFLRKLSELPGFGIARSLLADNYAVQEVVVLGRLPEAEKLRAAKAARARVDEGLIQLQGLLPDNVQQPLERCFGGELRLVDVSEEFVDWIREKGLESAFTVEAS